MHYCSSPDPFSAAMVDNAKPPRALAEIPVSKPGKQNVSAQLLGDLPMLIQQGLNVVDGCVILS